MRSLVLADSVCESMGSTAGETETSVIEPALTCKQEANRQTWTGKTCPHTQGRIDCTMKFKNIPVYQTVKENIQCYCRKNDKSTNKQQKVFHYTYLKVQHRIFVPSLFHSYLKKKFRIIQKSKLLLCCSSFRCHLLKSPTAGPSCPVLSCPVRPTPSSPAASASRRPPPPPSVPCTCPPAC